MLDLFILESFCGADDILWEDFDRYVVFSNGEYEDDPTGVPGFYSE